MTRPKRLPIVDDRYQENVCPGCGIEIIDENEQRLHMAAAHPTLVADRLTAAGFRQDPDGCWIDCWSDG